MNQTLGVAWYRFRATFGGRWSGYLTIMVLIGIVGGLSMGSIAAGRRTGSSFSVYLASTNPSDLSVEVILDSGGNGYSPALTQKLAHLPHVRRVEAATLGLNIAPVTANGSRDTTPAEESVFEHTEVVAVGSVTGLYFDEDRVTVVRGHMADPSSDDEVVMTPEAATLLGVRLGEVIPVGFYTNAQSQRPNPGKPAVQVDIRVVGLVAFNDAVIQDQINRYPTEMLFSLALTRRIVGSGAGVSLYGLQLDGGDRYLSRVEQEIGRAAPASQLEFHVNALVSSEAEQTIRPEAVALDVFGAIAAIAALLIAGQTIGRQLRARDDEVEVLRALGAGSGATIGDGLIGIVGAVVAGAVLAVGVAVALSPLGPIGPVRPVYPSRGIAFDVPVLGIGFAVLVVGLGALAVVLAVRGAPGRVYRRPAPAVPHGSSIAHLAAVSGLSAPAVAGVRLALESGRGSRAVPVRSAIVGTVIAVVLVVATLTFGSSLTTLVSHPGLYGWNWNYAFQASGGYGDIPTSETASLLAHNHDVVASSGVAFLSIELDGATIPVLFTTPHAAVAPPILSGHGVNGPDQIVLGAATLAALGKHVGGAVVASYGVPNNAPEYLAPTTLRIVGTATMPAIGTPQGLHASMGTGALADASLIGEPSLGCDGPSSDVLVRLRSGVTPTAGLASMDTTTAALQRKFLALPSSNACAGESIELLGTQLPAEIVNYKSMGATPAALASGVAAAAVVALGLTLVASVRRRRRDLALFKTLGFTKHQLASTVAWQSSIAVGIGTVVGVPLGIVLGRALWDLFAHAINAVPSPSIPGWSIALVAAGALILANIVAAVPGRIATRTPTALLLRVE